VPIGKLPTGQALCDDFGGYLHRFHFTPLPISVEHGRLAGRLPGPHKDPFDRMLAAQALVEGVPLVTNDPAFAGFGVNVVWQVARPAPRPRAVPGLVARGTERSAPQRNGRRGDTHSKQNPAYRPATSSWAIPL
jgi:hypothetical protein